MDGVRLVPRLAYRWSLLPPLLVSLLLVGLPIGCAGIDAKDDSVPFAMYDSPLVAGAFDDGGTGSPRMAPGEEDDEPEAPSDEATEPTRATPPTRSASTADESADEESSKRSDEQTESDDGPPALASRRTTTTETESSEKNDDQSRSDASDGTSKPQDPASSTPSSESRTSVSSARESTAEPATDGDDSDSRPVSTAAQYAAAIYELNDVGLPEEAHTSIPELYRTCRNRGALFQDEQPAAGDLAFFHNVRDANDDGRNNDWYTHVALVESVDSDGRVSLFGYRGGEVRRWTMTLGQKGEHRSKGEVVNSRLREPAEDDPPYTRYLAGELFAGYCSMLGDRSELMVVDNWEPGMELDPPEE